MDRKTLTYIAIGVIIVAIVIFIWLSTRKEEEEEYPCIGCGGPPPLEPPINGNGQPHNNGNIHPPDPWDPGDPCANVPSGMGVAVYNPTTGRYEMITCP